MSILAVDAKGTVKSEDLEAYVQTRRAEVGKRLAEAFESSSVAKAWFESFSEKELHEDGGDEKYLGDGNSEAQTKTALARAKATENPTEIVSAVEEVILCFCGFNNMKPLPAKCIVNAVHFQFGVDIDKLLAADLSLPSADGAPTDAEKALFDEADIGLAELLLRVVVETTDGGLLANPFSPGMPMGKLLKLPPFAQFVMVLTNAVEATWYQAAVPTCPMAINLYASLLVAEAPVLQMTSGVRVVEVMEMTKGAKRGPEVDDWVAKIRAADWGGGSAIVMLDDFDMKHPGLGSKPDGIKTSVFANAFHSLQAFKNQPFGEPPAPLLPILATPVVQKEKPNAFDLMDYYCSIVPQHQSGAKILIMEGSENCLKAEVSPGPPLNFGEPRATTASAHVYQAAARAMRQMQPAGQAFEMYHQGGRALYADEDFDEDALAVIATSGKAMPAARAGDAGTMAWMGQEAVRRAAMKSRLPVCAVVKKPAA